MSKKGKFLFSLLLLSPALLFGQESIDPRTGQLQLTYTDLVVPAGAVQLEVMRTLWHTSDEEGLLSPQWRLNWEKRLVRVGPVAVIEEEAKPVVFEHSGNNLYKTNRGEQLEFNEDGRAVRTLPSGIKETFDAQGRLIEQDQLNGNKITLHYKGDGRLDRVDGPNGCFIKLLYDDTGRLTSVEASNKNKINYIYNKDGLQDVRFNGASFLRYAYDEEGRLLEIDDPLSGLVNFAYDDKGRVTFRRWGDGSEELHEYDDTKRTYRHIDPAGKATTFCWSEDGIREEVTDPLGQKTVTVYDERGLPVSITDPAGSTLELIYDDQARLTSISDPNEGRTWFEYKGTTVFVSRVTYPDGSSQTFEYDNSGNLLAVKQGDEIVVSRSYTPNGLVASMEGRSIPRRQFSYYSNGRLQSEVDVIGQITRFEYDTRGNLIRKINPAGGVTAWKYDEQNRVVSKTDPSGHTRHYFYDGAGRLIQQINPTGGSIRFQYDNRGRLAEETDQADRTTRYEYDALGHLIQKINPDNSVYKYEYDAVGNLIRETNPLGGVTARTYDPAGRLLSITDPTGRTWRYKYDRSGRLANSLDPEMNISQFKYNPNGYLESARDPENRATLYERDKEGRIMRILSPEGSMSFDYNRQGQLAKMSDDGGSDEHYEYDELGRLIRKRRSINLEIGYQYDALGNLVKTWCNHGRVWTMKYDKLGRLVGAAGPSGAMGAYSYDAAGRLLKVTDALGNNKEMFYTRAGELAKVTEASRGTATYKYDKSGRLSLIHRPGSGEIRYSYDGMGNLLTATHHLGATTRYKYDKAGRPVRRTDAKGQITTQVYDAAGRLSEKRLHNGKKVTYKYDAGGNILAVDDGTFPVRYARDAKGRVMAIEYPALHKSLSYKYDGNGRLSVFTDSEGREISYEYDGGGRLKAIQLSEDEAFTFTYDPWDRLARLKYPNGIQGVWEYDTAGRAVRITYSNADGNTLVSWEYKYDPAGNLTEEISSDGRVKKYHYDEAAQLVEENGPTGEIFYSYFPGGNRASLTRGGKKLSYKYDEDERLVKAGGETFQHDNNGNIIERRGANGATQYIYDAEDRLIKVILPDGREVTFGYLPMGGRVWRRDDKGLTYFVTDSQNLLAELDENLKIKASYVYGPGFDRPLLMQRNGYKYFYHAKSLGTIDALSDSQGELAASYDMDAFGCPVNASSPVENPFLFVGREYDQEIGLYYFRARYYDPELGRFISPDPVFGDLTQPATLTPYIYALNNPLRYVDPKGELITTTNEFGWDPLYDPLPRYDPIAEVMVGDRPPTPPINPLSEQQKLEYYFAKMIRKSILKDRGLVREPVHPSKLPSFHGNKTVNDARPGRPQPPGPNPHDVRGPKTIRGRPSAGDGRPSGGSGQVDKPPSEFQKFMRTPVGRITGMLGIGALIIDATAAVLEGEGGLDLLMNTVTKIAVGFGFGKLILAVPVVGPVLLTVAAPALVILGTGWAIHRCGMAWANRPARAQWENLRQEQERRTRIFLEFSIGQLEKEVDSKLEELEKMRVEAIAAAEEVKREAKDAEEAAKNAKRLMTEFRSLINSVRASFLQCEEAVAARAEIEAAQREAEKTERLVVDVINGIKQKASELKKEEDAAPILERYNECKKLTAELAGQAKWARSKNDQLLKRTKRDVTRGKAQLKKAEQLMFQISDEADKVATIASTYLEKLEKARGLQQRFNRAKALLKKRIQTFRSAFAKNIDPKYESRYMVVREKVNQVKEIREATVDTETGISGTYAYFDRFIKEGAAAEAVQMKLDAENLLRQIGEVPDACEEVETADDAVEKIEASAANAQKAVDSAEDLVKKVEDYLAKARSALRAITVYVQDEQSKPIQGALVSMEGSSGVNTDSAGNAKTQIPKDKDVTITASATGYKSSSATVKADSIKEAIALILVRKSRIDELREKILSGGKLTEKERKELQDLIRRKKPRKPDIGGKTPAPPVVKQPPAKSPVIAGERIFFMPEYFMKEQTRFCGPRFSFFYVPSSSDPCGGTSGLSIVYIDAKEAEAARNRLKREGNKLAELQFPELWRFHYIPSHSYHGDNVIAITCNGQTRYRHTVCLKDSQGSGGSPSCSNWGEGFHFGLKPGKHEAKVTVFSPEGKLAEFLLKFIVERDPKIDKDEIRNLLQKCRQEIEYWKRELAQAGGNTEKENMAAINIAYSISGVIRVMHKYEEVTPDQISLLFEQFVSAWEYMLQVNLRVGGDHSAILEQPDDICWMIGTPRALSFFEQAIALAESNAKRLHVTNYDLARRHFSAATLAISAANDVQKARNHLQRYVQIKTAIGEEIEERAYQKMWPKVWGTGTDQKKDSP